MGVVKDIIKYYFPEYLCDIFPVFQENMITYQDTITYENTSKSRQIIAIQPGPILMKNYYLHCELDNDPGLTLDLSKKKSKTHKK